MDDLATLGFEIPSQPMATASTALDKMAASSKTAEQAAKSLATATVDLGAKTETTARRLSQYDEAHAKNVRSAVMAADATGRAAAAQAAATRTAGSEVTRQYAAMTSAAQRYATEMSRTVDRIKVADAYQASLKAAQRTIADTAKGAAAAVAATGVTWKQFVADRMGDYMRLEGSHGAAMTRIGAEWQAYKQTLTGTAVAAENASKRIVAATATTQRAVGYMGTPGQVGLNAQQRVMLGYQLQDVFTSLASGMNPAMVAAQQGPQISMLYGGFRNMLGAIPKPLLIGGGVAAAGVGGVLGVNALADAQDELRTQDRRFGTMMGGDGAGMIRDIGRMASAASIGIDQATESVEGFAKATRGLGAARQDILGIAESMEKLIKLSGANDNEAGAAREGVAGMLKQATVNADQLKAVLANAPRIVDQIAAGLGVSATQLRLMADQGDLTNRQVLDAMVKRSTEVNAEFAAMPKSVGDLFSSIGTDLGMALKNLADSIPLVNQYRNALELAAKAAKAIRDSSAGETAPQVIARTSGAGAGAAPIGLAPGLSPGAAAGSMIAQRDFYAAQFDAAADEVQQWAAGVRSAVKAADEALVSAAGVARKFDPLGAEFRDNQRDVDAMEKALANLQAWLTKLSASEAANQIGILTGALQRAREAARDIDPALKSLNDISRRNDFRANDNTPAGMALQASIQSYVDRGSNRENATTAALAEQQEKVADLVKAKNEEAEASDKITAAMGRGKKALIEAQVEAAVLAFIMANIGKNTEGFAAQIEEVRGAFKKIFTNESIQAGINAAKPLEDELAGIAAAMKAVEQGAYAMKRAEAEARAARDENGTGGLQMQVFDARQQLTDASTLSDLKQEIDLTNKLAAAAGDVARQKAIQLDFDIKRAQQNADPSNADKIAAEMRAKAAAETRRETAEGAAEIERQVELTKQQVEIVRTGNADYAAQLAMLQKKNDLLARGGDLASDEAQRQITGAGNLAKANVELDRAKEAADATKRIWMNAFDGVQSYGADVFFDIFRGVGVDGKSAAEALKNIFLRAFAEIAAAAIIRPIIAPIFNAAGSMLGGSSAMPAAIGQPGMGGMFGGLGNMFGGGSSAPGSMFGTQGLFGGAVPSSPDVMGPQMPGAFGAGGSLSNFFNPSTGLQMGSFGMGNLSGALGVGMGAMSLLNGRAKTTAGTIGGIGQMVGGGLMMIPTPWTMAAGAVISLASSILPGLFESKPEPPTMRASSALNFSGGAFRQSGGAYGGASEINLGGIGGTMKSLLDAAGVTLKDSPYGLMQQTYSKGDFSNATTFVNGRQWGQSSSGDAGLDTAAAHVAHQIMLEVGSGISDLMHEGLKNFGLQNLDHAFSTQELGQAVTDLKSLDDALKNLGKTTTDAEQALKQIDDRFAGLRATADKYGLDPAAIDAQKAKERQAVAGDFAGGLQRQLDDLVDPLKGALADLDKQKQALLDENRFIVDHIQDAVDQAGKIEELFGKKRAAIVEESTRAAAEAEKRLADQREAFAAQRRDMNLEVLGITDPMAAQIGGWQREMAQFIKGVTDTFGPNSAEALQASTDAMSLFSARMKAANDNFVNDMRDMVTALEDPFKVQINGLMRARDAAMKAAMALDSTGKLMQEASLAYAAPIEKMARDIKSSIDAELLSVRDPLGAQIKQLGQERDELTKKAEDVNNALMQVYGPTYQDIVERGNAGEALSDADREFLQRMQENRVDMLKIEESYLQKEMKLKEDYFRQTLGGIEDLIKRLTLGDLSGVNAAEAIAGSKASYAAALAQARANPLDQARLDAFTQAANEYGTLSRNTYGNSTDFYAIQRDMLAAARSLDASVRAAAGNGGVNNNTKDDENAAMFAEVLKSFGLTLADFSKANDKTNDLLIKVLTELQRRKAAA